MLETKEIGREQWEKITNLYGPAEVPVIRIDLRYRSWTILENSANMTVDLPICWIEMERFPVSISGILRSGG